MHIFLPTGTPFFIAYSFVFKKKKKERNTQSLSVFVASTSSVLYWHCDNALWQRISGKRSLQVLCICQVSSKRLTQGADWRKITKQKKRTFSHFSKPEHYKIHPQKPCQSLHLSQTLILVQRLYQRSKPQFNNLQHIRDLSTALHLAYKMVCQSLMWTKQVNSWLDF